MEQIKISMDNGGVQTLNKVEYISELIKNLIYLDALHANGFSYISDRDMDIMKVNNGALTMMREMKTSGNIYKLLRNTLMVDVASIEFDNDTTKLWHMRLSHLNERVMM